MPGCIKQFTADQIEDICQSYKLGETKDSLRLRYNRGLLCTECNFKVGYRETTTLEEYAKIDVYLEKWQ